MEWLSAISKAMSIYRWIKGIFHWIIYGVKGRKKIDSLKSKNKELRDQLDNCMQAKTNIGCIKFVTYVASEGGNIINNDIQSSIEKDTTENLKNTIRSLDQKPFGDGHTYAKLPEGTRIVSMKDGSYRLAIPVLIKDSLTIEASVSRPVVKIERPGNETSG